MFQASDDDFDIDEEFLQDVFQIENANNDTKAEKRKSDEKISPDNCWTKKTRGDSHDKAQLDDEIMSDELLELTELAESQYTSNALNSTSSRGNTSSADISYSAPDKCTPSRRKFPGPAGLLPQIGRGGGAQLELVDHESKDRAHKTAEDLAPLSSQTGAELMAGPAWQEAANTLQMRLGDSGCPLGRYNVAWVRQRAVAKRLPQHKVPFLLVGVRSVEPSSRDPSVTLQDQTGEIYGILHRELWSEYASQLVPGAVLALRQVSVLSTGPFARHQCLNVTANNVVSIFIPGNSQGVDTTQVRPVSREQLLRDVIETPDSPVPSLPTSPRPEGLFGSVGDRNKNSRTPGLRVPVSLGFPNTPVRSQGSSVGSPLQSSTPKSSFVSRSVSHNSKPSFTTSHPPSGLASVPHSGMTLGKQGQRRDNIASSNTIYPRAVNPAHVGSTSNKHTAPQNTVNNSCTGLSNTSSSFTPKRPLARSQVPAALPPTPHPEVQSLLEGLDPDSFFEDF